MFSERRGDYYSASHWLQAGVVAVLLGIFATWLLRTLADTQERSEKLAVELTWRYMRSGLKLAVGDALLHGRAGEVSQWVGRNPSDFLAAPPPGYVGECPLSTVSGLAAGAWCFDRGRRELVYRPKRDEQLRLLGASEVGDGGAKVLRWRIVASGQPVMDGSSNIGLTVELVTPYLWYRGYD